MWKTIKCLLGLHDWQPTADAILVFRSKWDIYHATPLVCDNCHKTAELREDYGYY